jgi:hypothetical protein
LTLKTKNEALKTGGRVLPPTRAKTHRASRGQRPQRWAICGGAGGRKMRSDYQESPVSGEALFLSDYSLLVNVNILIFFVTFMVIP